MHRPNTVHPHIRGAYIGSFASSSSVHGSSPHTWGIPDETYYDIEGDRFIPTYVGHTAAVLASSGVMFGSSPHTWGIREASAAASGGNGSSPHTWGILESTCLMRRCSRFIPTYVGHTFCPLNERLKYAVHPHIRGAYKNTSRRRWTRLGSSPHTWGIQRGCCVHG